MKSFLIRTECKPLLEHRSRALVANTPSPTSRLMVSATLYCCRPLCFFGHAKPIALMSPLEQILAALEQLPVLCRRWRSLHGDLVADAFRNFQPDFSLRLADSRSRGLLGIWHHVIRVEPEFAPEGIPDLVNWSFKWLKYVSLPGPLHPKRFDELTVS